MSRIEYDADRFRKMLEDEMGSMTKRDFARKCGITPEAFSRISRKNNPLRPGDITLRKIAENSNLDLNELRQACGYLTEKRGLDETPDEVAKGFIADMDAGFADLTGKTRLYDSLEGFLAEFDMLYSRQHAKVTYAAGERREFYGNGRISAEYFAPVCAKFEAGSGIFRIFAVLYFCETLGGKILVTDYALDGASLKETGVITPAAEDMIYEAGGNVDELPYYYTYQLTRNPEEAILKAIFSHTMIEYPDAVSGFGFTMPDPCDAFSGFLEAHRRSFCTGEKEEKLYGRFAAGKGTPEEIFSEYKAPYTSETGLGAVVAKIMCEETDILFEWTIGERGSRSCILYTGDDYGIDDLRRIVYPYARELGVEKYGACYVLTHNYIDEADVFTISEEDGSDEK